MKQMSFFCLCLVLLHLLLLRSHLLHLVRWKGFVNFWNLLLEIKLWQDHVVLLTHSFTLLCLNRSHACTSPSHVRVPHHVTCVFLTTSSACTSPSHMCVPHQVTRVSVCNTSTNTICSLGVIYDRPWVTSFNLDTSAEIKRGLGGAGWKRSRVE